MHLPVVVAGQVHHPRQHRRTLDGGLVRGVVPHVLIDPERGDPRQAGLVAGELNQPGPDRTPHRLPRGPQLARQASDCGVLVAQLSDRPGHGPAAQRPAGSHERRVLLDEHPDRTPRIGAPPRALAPPDHHRHGSGHVMQPAHPPSTADRDDPAPWAAHQLPGRGDSHRQHRRAPLDVLDVDAVQAEQDITTGAGISRGCADAPRSVGQRRGPRSDQDAWSLPILGDPDPITTEPGSPASRAPYRKSDEPRTPTASLPSLLPPGGRPAGAPSLQLPGAEVTVEH